MSTEDVARLIGVSYRQLSYWCSQGLIPGQPARVGSGSAGYRRWTAADISRARLVANAAELRAGSLADTVTRLDENIRRSAS
jgi:DNA-binding transcriptional MerR regulator